MAIHQSKKQTDLEKRLQLLRHQVYGKNHELPTTKFQLSQVSQGGNQSKKPEYSVVSDLSYLNQDLLKILIFSSLAIGVQIILFFLSNKHILNLNFF